MEEGVAYSSSENSHPISMRRSIFPSFLFRTGEPTQFRPGPIRATTPSLTLGHFHICYGTLKLGRHGHCAEHCRRAHRTEAFRLQPFNSGKFESAAPQPGGPLSHRASEDVAAGGMTDLVKNAAAERVRKAFNRATGIAAATAKLGGKYEDAWGNRENRILGGSRDVGLVNDLAKADMATLQPDQDLAAYGVYKTPSAWPQIGQSVGALLGGLAGSGYLRPQPPKAA